MILSKRWAEDMIKGTLLTALPLTQEQHKEIEERFSAVLDQPVSLEEKVDNGLIGGIRVELGGRIFDDSLKSKLHGMLSSYQHGSLKGEQDGEAQAAEGSQENGQQISLDWKAVGRELKRRLKSYTPQLDVRGAGVTLTSGDGVVSLSGLAGCRLGELIEYEDGGFGIIMKLGEESVSAVLLGNDAVVSVGTKAYGTGQVLSVPVGEDILGRVINPLGQPLDGQGLIHGVDVRPIESPAPSILDRKPVTKPMETGLMAVDAMVPIGRGQRELIIGDRQTGKSSVAIDTILNQKGKNVVCFYVAIGQKASSVAQIVAKLKAAGAMAYTTVICSTASDSATMQYIAPYCGCAMAEWFMQNGRDALVIYDDLSKHAVAYRAISLLLRRPPGREAYPGDVFYLHSRLLERAACLSDKLGGGSMTALPIVETLAGDISAYIPTNVISITDGQIFLDTELFREGVRPAVSGGLSVSRVGGAAQTKAMRKCAGQLRLELAQYRELQIFAQFSSDLDPATQDMLKYGAMLMELLKQSNNAPLGMAIQVSLLYAVTRAIIPHEAGVETIKAFKAEFPNYLSLHYPQVILNLEEKQDFDESIERDLTQAVKTWLAKHEAEAKK
jgi:F-type H+-transporting ATPase subunit alpha